MSKMMMIPDDVYQQDFENIVAQMRYWAPSVADVAKVEEEEGPGYRIFKFSSAYPGGCPFEFVIRQDQHYDLRVAAQHYLDQPARNLMRFHSLSEAIVEGRVSQLYWHSIKTGVLRGIQTQVRLADGSIWREGMPEPEECESRTRTFLPYRR